MRCNLTRRQKKTSIALTNLFTILQIHRLRQDLCTKNTQNSVDTSKYRTFTEMTFWCVFFLLCSDFLLKTLIMTVYVYYSYYIPVLRRSLFREKFTWFGHVRILKIRTTVRTVHFPLLFSPNIFVIYSEIQK